MARRDDDEDETEDRAGHNSGISAKELKAFVERIERLEEDKKAVSDDIRDVYAEAKGRGFDTKTMRKLVSMRKKDADQRREEEAMLELYMNALGMLLDI